MKKIIVVIGLLLTSTAFAQSPYVVDSLLSIIKLSPNNSAQQWLELSDAAKVWHNTTGLNEANYRLRTLIELKNNNFNVTDSSIFYLDIYRYKKKFRRYSEAVEYNFDKYGKIPMRSEFDYTTREIADYLLNTFQSKSLDKNICQLYSSRKSKLFNQLEHGRYSGTLLQQSFDSIRKSQYRGEFAYNLLFGSWIPTGNLKFVEPKLFFGIGGDVHLRKYSFGLSVHKIIEQKVIPYNVIFNDTLRTVNSFTGFNFSGHFGYKLYDLFAKELWLCTSIGTERYDFNSPNPETDSIYYTEIKTPVLTLGCKFNYRVYPSLHFSISPLYSLIHIENTGGTNLSGGYFSLRIMVRLALKNKHYNDLYFPPSESGGDIGMSSMGMGY